MRSASISISHLPSDFSLAYERSAQMDSDSPSQSTFRSILILPSRSVFVTLTFENLKGTCPRSIFVKCNDANGPGSIVLNMGSTVCLTMSQPATLMFGHRLATSSLSQPV